MHGAISLGGAWAVEEGPTDGKTAETKTRLMSAVITAVHAEDRKVSVQRKDGTTSTLEVTPETAVLVSDEPGTLADLQVDTKASISYQERAGKQIARWIRDALTVRIRDAESTGVKAIVTAVDVPEGILQVRTAFGKVRALMLIREGKKASRIMKAGKITDLSSFQVRDPVMISIRRTSGATLYLKSLADVPTFVAFLRDSCVEGLFHSADPESQQIVVTLPEGDPVTVGFSRRTKFFREGQEIEGPLFEAGQAIWVLYRTKKKDLIRSRIIFDRDSWRPYAQAAIAAEKEMEGEAEKVPQTED